MFIWPISPAHADLGHDVGTEQQASSSRPTLKPKDGAARFKSKADLPSLGCPEQTAHGSAHTVQGMSSGPAGSCLSAFHLSEPSPLPP